MLDDVEDLVAQRLGLAERLSLSMQLSSGDLLEIGAGCNLHGDAG
jgi:hypothetical protein